MASESVSVTIDAGVATVEIARPQVMNAVAASTVRELRQAFQTLREDGAVRAVVLTGRGRAFCTGADLSDAEMSLDGPLAARSGKLARLMADHINPLISEIQTFPKPTLAAVNGPAVGGGVGLALAADMAVAAESAYFMQVFTPRLGLVPDMGVTWHLERRVGRARARGLALLGDRLSAAQAASWGLIWKSVADDAFAAEVATLSRRLADLPALAARALKGILDEAGGNTFADQLDRECAVQCQLVGSEDAQEAVVAFREKRPPVFAG